MEQPWRQQTATTCLAQRRAPKAAPATEAAALSERRVQLRESRCLASAADTATGSAGTGQLEVRIEFVVSTPRKGRARRRRRGRRESGDRYTGVLSQLSVHTCSAMPLDASEWTRAPLLPADKLSETVSLGRSEAAAPSTARAAAAAAIATAASGGDNNPPATGRKKRRPQRRRPHQTPPPPPEPPTTTRTGSIGRRLRELELLSRRLGRPDDAASLRPLAAAAAGDGASSKLSRTRQQLLVLQSLTDNALRLLGQCQGGLCAGDGVRTSASGGPASTEATVDAQTRLTKTAKSAAAAAAAAAPKRAGSRAAPRRAYCTYAAIESLTTGPPHLPLLLRCARVADQPPAKPWPGCLAFRLPHQSRCQALRHSGGHPVVSRVLFAEANSARFSCQHRPPLSTAGPDDRLRVPAPPRLFCRWSDSSDLRWWLPPGETAASQQLLTVPVCGLCSVQAACLTAYPRWSAHRLQVAAAASGGRRCALEPRLLAASQTSLAACETAAAVVVLAPAAEQLEQPLWPRLDLGEATEFHSASSCLRLAVCAMPEPRCHQRLCPQPSGCRTANWRRDLHATVLASDCRDAAQSCIAFRVPEIETAADISSKPPALKDAGASVAVSVGDAEGDKPDLSSASALWPRLPMQFNNCNSGGSGGSGGGGSGGSSGSGGSGGGSDQDSPKRSAKTSSDAGWDFVYLRTETEVQLVELQDTQERSSNVSTVLGLVGFSLPLLLAVPCRLLPPGAFPVVSGNVLELGDWDISGAEAMEPTSEPAVDGFVFFEATVGSNYSSEDDVEFRFAIVLPMGDGASSASTGRGSSSGAVARAEIFCWEGLFIRRMASYKDGGGRFCLLGREEPLTSPQQLQQQPPPPPLLLAPGWLSDCGQAMLLLALDPPSLAACHPRLAQLPVELELVQDGPTDGLGCRHLTPNFRGPLTAAAAAAAWDPAKADFRPGGSGAPNRVRFPAAADARVEFVQLLPAGDRVHFKIRLRFLQDGDAGGGGSGGLKATARLTLTPHGDRPSADAEADGLVCELREEDGQTPAIVGHLTVRVHRVGHSQQCQQDALRSLDRCGLTSGPPGPCPVRVLPLPTECLLAAGPGAVRNAPLSNSLTFVTSVYELPLGVSADGRRLRLLPDRGLRPDDLCRRLPALGGLVVRLELAPGPVPVDAAADSVLGLLLDTERWTLLAAPDLRLCVVLTLKQMRLPVALVLSAEEAAADSAPRLLDACRHYGLRAVVAPAAALADGGRGLLEAAAARGLGVYAARGGQLPEPEVAALLEGTFAESPAV